MNDLNPDARRLVDLARQHRTPGEDAKSRIADRLAVPLAASLAAGTTAAAAKAAAAAEMAAGAKAGATLFGSLGFKVAAVLTLSAAVTTLAVSQLVPGPSTASAPRHTPAAAAPAPAKPAPAVATPEAPTNGAVNAAPADALLPQKNQLGPPKHGSEPSHELAQEAALLHEAQAAWRAGQSAQALSLANQHAQRFPHSQLGNERDVLRVLSLCKLGQVQAAKQVGAHLLKSAKGSPWYQSVAGSCAAR
jgi:hypothetical protein